MNEVQWQDDVAAYCLLFLVYTVARLSEARGATWGEIEGDVWTVPATRMKSGREHRIPISTVALDLLARIPRRGRFVFSDGNADRPIPAGRLRRIVKAVAGDGITLHGFRSAFRDWAGERTNFPREIAEAALAHVVGDATERAYRRADALEKRRTLMEAWAKYCTNPPAAAVEALPIGRTRRG